MKIVYFATYYEAYLADLYKRHPALAARSYSEQLETILDDHFGVFGSYTRHARSLGHDARLLIANCEPLQKKWANENNLAWDERTWRFSVAAAQVKMAAPDIFFIGSMFPYYGSFIDEIRPYCKKITGWISCPIPGNTPYKKLSLILTSAPHYADQFRREGVASEVLLPAFDQSILPHIDHTLPRQDLTFIGSVSEHHRKRNEYLQRLMLETNISIYGIAGSGSRKEKLFDLFRRDALKKKVKKPVFGNAMYSLLAASRITFNMHIDFMTEYAGNMRMFEATGAGTLLLTDHKKNVHELFEPGREIVTYVSPEDAVEKAKYYLSHEAERSAIARAGQSRTLRDYHFSGTMEKMLGLFRAQLS